MSRLNGLTLDSFAAFADTTNITQPGSVSGNNLLDTISGVIKGITPAAATAVTQKLTKQQQQMIGQILPGQQATTNYTPWLIVGGIGLAVWAFFLMKRK